MEKRTVTEFCPHPSSILRKPPEEATVCVQDLQGKTLHSFRVPAGSLQCDIDLGGQPDGLYLVEITCNGQHRSYKLVKK